jgi:hypothetical protein
MSVAITRHLRRSPRAQTGNTDPVNPVLLVVFVVLVLAVWFTDVRSFREDTLPAIRRARAGIDRMTPRRRRTYVVVATCLAVAAAISWFFVADGVGLTWSPLLAGAFTLAAIAFVFWIIVAWLGERERERERKPR